MKKFLTGFLMLSLWLIVQLSSGQFICIPLGINGGLSDDNLSSYLISVDGYTGGVCLDAGTLFAGISRAYKEGSFSDLEVPANDTLTPEGWILRNYIKAYAISHAHLDHFSGLVMASVEDSPKTIYGSAITIDYLKNNIFNWKIWPNFGNEGVPYPLNKYTYHVLATQQPVEVTGTGITISSFTLSHSEPYQSNAFLLGAGGDYILYIGDTGADEVERTGHLDSVWTLVAPLVKEGRIKALFLEVSYPDGVPDNRLHGHLTSSWHIRELTSLAIKANRDNYRSALKGIRVMVTGIKPSLKKGVNTAQVILQELNSQNELGVRFIIPEQGKRYEF